MSNNSRFAVAVHILSVLGYMHKNGVDRMCSEQIAKSVNTNAVVIRNMLRQLKFAGLIESKEGKDGGIRLAKPASQITLDMIYTAVDLSGPFGMNKKPQYKPCPVSCEMKRILPEIFKDVQNAVAKTLRNKTLDEILGDIKA